MRSQPRFRLSIQLLVLLAALLPAAVWAGGVATIQSGGENMKIAWQDDGAVRMDTSDAGQYMIMRDGKMYSVSMQNGQPMVMELSGMLKAMAKSQKQPEGTLVGHVDKVEATGASETIAGIEGRVYRITTTGPDGKTETVETVLTDNPLVVAMTKAYMEALLGMMAPEAAESLMAALPDDDRGMLRSGTDFKLTSISADAPDPSQFELPAEPKSLAKMMQEAMSKAQQ